MSILRRLSISQKLLISHGLLFVTCIFTIVSVYITLQKQKADAVIINLAGRQRMLTQKMTKEMLNLIRGNRTSEDVNFLRSTMRVFETTLDALYNGGKAPLDLKMTRFREIPPSRGMVRKQLEKVKFLWEKFKPHLLSILREGDSNATSQDVTYVMEHNLELLSEMNKAVGLMQKSAEKKISALRIEIGVLGILSLIVFMISFNIAGGIVRPLKEFVDKFKRGAEGDLTIKVEIDNEDEIGEMAKVFNQFMDSLNTLICSAKDLSHTASQSVSESAEVITNFVSSSRELSSKTESIASATEELNATVKEIADLTRQANERSEGVAEMATQGTQELKNLIDRIQDIVSVEQDFANKFTKLTKDSSQVSDVVVVINDIADKTNLLALNAAIEAARAGEAGRGFSVVADEIRKLAEKTKDSTKEIRDVIGKIQKDIKTMSDEVIRNVDIVKEMAAKALDVGNLIEQMNQAISEVRTFINHVTSATEEQSLATSDISQNITNISSALSQYTKSMMDISANMEQLSQKVEEMNVLLNRFITQ